MSHPSGRYRPPTFDPPPIRQQSWTSHGSGAPPVPPDATQFFTDTEPPRPPRSPWYRRTWVIALAMFVLGLGIGGAMTEEATTGGQDRTPAAARSETSSPPTPAKKVAAVPSGLTGDGTYLIGSDIQAGTYRSKGGDLCYWARLKRTDGELTSILANHVGPGAQVVTIKSTDKAFETRGCADWVLSK
jgi:hypothetical protein